MENFRSGIRDKHSGSATLAFGVPDLLSIRIRNNISPHLTLFTQKAFFTIYELLSFLKMVENLTDYGTYPPVIS
jgi:hypothetical protein